MVIGNLLFGQAQVHPREPAAQVRPEEPTRGRGWPPGLPPPAAPPNPPPGMATLTVPLPPATLADLLGRLPLRLTVTGDGQGVTGEILAWHRPLPANELVGFAEDWRNRRYDLLAYRTELADALHPLSAAALAELDAEAAGLAERATAAERLERACLAWARESAPEARADHLAEYEQALLAYFAATEPAGTAELIAESGRPFAWPAAVAAVARQDGVVQAMIADRAVTVTAAAPPPGGVLLALDEALLAAQQRLARLERRLYQLGVSLALTPAAAEALAAHGERLTLAPA